MNIPEPVWLDLIAFLKMRESDIALDMEDFGDLKEVFKFVFGREPRDHSRTK